MGIFADAERDEGEVEIERQLDAAIGEIEIEIGFRSNVVVRVSRYPEGDLDVTLANPNAKEEALGSLSYENEFNEAFYDRAKGDSLQQAVVWVRRVCEPEVLRQKRQAEILEAIYDLLFTSEEKPPVSRRWPVRMSWEGATRPEPYEHADDVDDDRPRIKKPRQGPPPPDPPFQC